MENQAANDWLIEEANRELIKAEQPELLEPEKFQDEDMVSRFGITILTEGKWSGAIKALATDFIVEEILPNGKVMTVTDLSQPKILAERDPTKSLFFKIIKTRISTLEAINRITQAAGVNKDRITYAGVKDATALTGQLACTKEISYDLLANFRDPNVILTEIEERSGGISLGSLQGNRFSILVRGDFAGVARDDLGRKIADIGQNGIPNFYGTQRFGAPRFISHHVGKAILQGNFKKALELWLFEESPYEFKLVTQIRRKMKALYGDWDAMLEISSIMPHTLRIERHFINEAKRRDLRVADLPHKEILAVEKEQMKFWIFAYASYLANKVLSLAGGETDDKLPLLITRDPKARELYDYFLTVDGTSNYHRVLSSLPWIYVSRETSIDRSIKPIFHHVSFEPDGVALQFDLPKGAYATILLQHLFALKPYSTFSTEQAPFVDILERLDGRNIPEEVRGLR